MFLIQSIFIQRKESEQKSKVERNGKHLVLSWVNKLKAHNEVETLGKGVKYEKNSVFTECFIGR